jgi:hypothetical protein
MNWFPIELGAAAAGGGVFGSLLGHAIIHWKKWRERAAQVLRRWRLRRSTGRDE